MSAKQGKGCVVRAFVATPIYHQIVKLICTRIRAKYARHTF